MLPNNSRRHPTIEHKTDHSSLLELFQSLSADTIVQNRENKDGDFLISCYHKYRQNPLYQTIKEKITKGEPVHPAEYIFHSLITDNVSSLQLKKLENINDFQLRLTIPHQNDLIKCIKRFLPNINVLAAALAYEKNNNIKNFNAFTALLASRHQNFRENYILNLSGIRLENPYDFDLLDCDSLIFQHCYFENAGLSKYLKFEASFCVFYASMLNNMRDTHRIYRDCTLIKTRYFMELNSMNSFIRVALLDCSLYFRSTQSYTYLEECKIRHCKITFEISGEYNSASLYKSEIFDSSITLASGRLYWNTNTVTRTVITSLENPTAKHAFWLSRTVNTFNDTDLTKATIDDPIQFLADNAPLMERGNRIFGNHLFATDDALDQFLTKYQELIGTNDRNLLRFTFLTFFVHPKTEALQERLAEELIAHIRTYYPMEGYPHQHIALLEQALNHPVFAQFNPTLYNSSVLGLFAPISTRSKARDALNKALNEALPDRSQHTAVSRLASF